MTPTSTALSPRVAGRFTSLHALVGNTPAIEIHCRYRDVDCVIVAKFEQHNFTGSIKDRMALHILEVATCEGQLRSGATIVEATSGNTGISLAALGRALDHPVRIHMPDWMSRERVLVIKSFGATIVPVSAEEGGFLGSIKQAEDWASANENAFLPRQFESASNTAAHELTTGPELLAQCTAAGHKLGAFVAGVGTGGTVMGVGRFLRQAVPEASVHPLEPANSPTLRTGKKVGKHRIQGISDEFVPAIVDLSGLDEIVDVWDGDAILMAQRLASELGFGVGISSGANFLGALKICHERGGRDVVGTVFPDCNKKYLSTDLCGDEEVREEYMTPAIKLSSCRVLPPA
ncbi:MAG: cysteine synthase A [Planctomycetota bacterium]|jgi:cysteine synthase A